MKVSPLHFNCQRLTLGEGYAYSNFDISTRRRPENCQDPQQMSMVPLRLRHCMKDLPTEKSQEYTPLANQPGCPAHTCQYTNIFVHWQHGIPLGLGILWSAIYSSSLDPTTPGASTGKFSITRYLDGHDISRQTSPIGVSWETRIFLHL